MVPCQKNFLEICHLESEIMKVKITQWCLTLCHPMDYTVHGILQARIPEGVAIPFSRGSSQPGDQTQVSHTAGRSFICWATRAGWKSTLCGAKGGHSSASRGSGSSDSKESAWPHRRPRFDLCIRKIPWRRGWLPTPVFRPGEFHGQRSLVGSSPWDHRVRHDWVTNTFTFLYWEVLHLRTRCQPARGGVPGSCWPLCAGEARSPARVWRGPLTLLVLECTKAIHAAEADWKHQESVREIPSSSGVLPVPSAVKAQRHACCKRKMLRGSRASKVSWIWGWGASHP